MLGVLHQERRLFDQAAGDADVVDAEEAAAGERDVPRGVQGKHAVLRVARSRSVDEAKFNRQQQDDNKEELTPKLC